ncbi:MAG: trehalose-phosphatase [Chloroflexota bacterium]|nr:trehalose-phosphatase [Chloroflexota bacterium]
MSEDALRAARLTLAAAPAGLVTDFDGTLSPIVADPDAARPLPGVADALQALARRLAVVAVVTGRAALDARARIGVSRLLLVGNHGIEWLAPGAERPDANPLAQSVGRLLKATLSGLPAEPGIRVEEKGLSATIHYREAAEPAQTRERLLAALEGRLDGLELREGRASLELRPVGVGDKGRALRTIVDRYSLRGLLVLGDDVTDLDMFRVAAELRQDGRLALALIGAVQGGTEVPAEVAGAADLVVDSVEAAASMLRALAFDDNHDNHEGAGPSAG